MYEAITCFCGNPSIGYLYKVYRAMREKVVRDKYPHIDPAQIPFMMEDGVEMKEILDRLKIDLDCCRAQFITNVTYHEELRREV